MNQCTLLSGKEEQGLLIISPTYEPADLYHIVTHTLCHPAAAAVVADRPTSEPSHVTTLLVRQMKDLGTVHVCKDWSWP
jgi:hypothetical protein